MSQSPYRTKEALLEKENLCRKKHFETVSYFKTKLLRILRCFPNLFWLKIKHPPQQTKEFMFSLIYIIRKLCGKSFTTCKKACKTPKNKIHFMGLNLRHPQWLVNSTTITKANNAASFYLDK